MNSTDQPDHTEPSESGSTWKPLFCRSRPSFVKPPQNLPAWAQAIEQAEQQQRRFVQYLRATQDFAAEKGFTIQESRYFGYDLYRDHQLVSRRQPLRRVVEAVGAQHIWANF